MDTVWRDTFVEEGNLSRHVSTLRKILNDDPKGQRFIKTVP
jgi:DNA-binding winged helix-turn-helix (wHTH) protein